MDTCHIISRGGGGLNHGERGLRGISRLRGVDCLELSEPRRARITRIRFCLNHGLRGFRGNTRLRGVLVDDAYDDKVKVCVPNRFEESRFGDRSYRRGVACLNHGFRGLHGVTRLRGVWCGTCLWLSEPRISRISRNFADRRHFFI